MHLLYEWTHSLNSHLSLHSDDFLEEYTAPRAYEAMTRLYRHARGDWYMEEQWQKYRTDLLNYVLGHPRNPDRRLDALGARIQIL